MTEFLIAAPPTILFIIAMMDAVDFQAQSPDIGLHWILTPKLWLIVALRGVFAAAFAFAIYFALYVFSWSTPSNLPPDFPSDFPSVARDVKMGVAAGLGVLSVLAVAQAVRLFPALFGRPAPATGLFLEPLVTVIGQATESLQRVKVQIIENEGKRLTRLKRESEARLANAILFKRKKSLAQVLEGIRQYVVQNIDLDRTGSPTFADEYDRIVRDLERLAGDDPGVLTFLATRRLVNLDSDRAKDLASKHLRLTGWRIPFSHFAGREQRERTLPYFADVHLPDTLYQPNRERLLSLLIEIDTASETTKEHGDALEAFTVEFLSSCRLLEVLEVNRVAIGQIDAACRVKSIPGLVTQDWTRYLPVECKNWKQRVGFPEIASLSKKMEDRHANTGLLIATEGVTGDWNLFQDALGEIRNEFIRGRRILVLRRSDLNRLVEGENLLNVLQEKLDELYFQRHKG